jgi:arylsulfatase A
MMIKSRNRKIGKRVYPILLSTGLITLHVACRNEASLKDDRPNIIFILADDLGYSELGCYGNSFNETPNLDKLAGKGVRFTQAYAAAPVSSPFRASLMTGQYPARVGITDYLRPDAGQFLDTAYVTLAEALKLNGYHTGIIGKWHLSGYKSKNAPVEMLPDRHGFDEVILSETTGIADGTYFHPYHFNPAIGKKSDSEKEFLVERMNLEAADFIGQNHKEPFFLYLSHYAVHTMVHGQPELVDHFRNKPGSGKSAPSPGNPENDPYKKYPADYFAPKNNPHLAAQLKVIDDGVGLILEKLEEFGILENTIIIFTSDNGGESRVTENSPLRAGKSTLYEGGVREPLIVFRPDRIAGGRTIEEPMSTYDFYPTICELTGTAMPHSQVFDGRSLASLLSGETDSSGTPRAFYWYYPLEERHFLGGRSANSVRYGDWKFIEFLDNGDKELYNLAEDPGETQNLLPDHAKADELQKMLDSWKSEVLRK